MTHAAPCAKQRSDKAEENLVAAAERGEDLPIGLRNDLGQLHGDANRMMATKLDAIVTMELNSGKQEARTTRKALIKSTEALIERVEGQVKRLDKLREAERS